MRVSPGGYVSFCAVETARTANRSKCRSRLGLDEERARGFEPPTYSLGSGNDRVVSGNPQGLTATTTDASPYASPCDAENVHAVDAKSRQDDKGEGDANKPVDLPAPDLERIAEELRAMLPADECRRLAGLLIGNDLLAPESLA